MRLSVKVLGGQECCVDAKDDYTVEQLKADIESKLKLGKTEQKLLFKGKTLQGNILIELWVENVNYWNGILITCQSFIVCRLKILDVWVYLLTNNDNQQWPISDMVHGVHNLLGLSQACYQNNFDIVI